MVSCRQFSGARLEPPNIFVHDLFGAYRSEVMFFIYMMFFSFMHFSMLVSTRKFDESHLEPME